MWDFLLNAIIWTLALYGLVEIIKTVIYISSYTNLKSDGLYVVIAVKNQEKRIEGFMRSILFRILYGKEEYIKNIIVADLDSKDNTLEILKKVESLKKVNKNNEIKISDWKSCKEIIESIKEN